MAFTTTTPSVSTPHSRLLKKPNFPLLQAPAFTPRKPTTATSRISCAAAATTTPTTTYKRHVYNFAAGPATLPESVLLKAQSDLFDFQNSGMSIMEMSHRGKEFDAVAKKAESDLRQLLSVPDDYAVLFLQGGATTQFATVPLNLCSSPTDVTDYLTTGSWSDKAFKEAAKFSSPNLVATTNPSKFTTLPSFEDLPQNPDARYLHICANETIHGAEFKNYPTPKNRDSIVTWRRGKGGCLEMGLGFQI